MRIVRPSALAVVVAALAIGGAFALACGESDSSNGLGGTSGKPASPDTGTPPGTAPDGAAPKPDAEPEPPPPTPSGCITDVTPGDHTFMCEGLSVDVSIPAVCVKPGCGLITEIHGDTGTGALMDANTNLHALGKQRGFIVVAPTGPPWPGGPGNTWRPPPATDDEDIVKIIQKVAAVFRTDPKKNHVTGFSRGGFVTWRLLCKHADLFASVAPGTAGSSVGGTCNAPVDEVSCPFDGTPNGKPSVEVPTIFLMGRTDSPVPFVCTSRIRDQLITAWGLAAQPNVAGDALYTHKRWTNAKGTVFETFEHSYETVSPGPWASARGHCFPGSAMDPQAPQYAVPCKGPNAFTWGEQVISFFEAHPKK